MASTCISSLAACSRRAIARGGGAGPARRVALAGLVGLLAAGTLVSLRSASPRFYPDDPLWTDDDRAMDASKAGPIEDSNGYDFVANTFGHPGERRDVRALNVNTVDEVPDSSWFTNRIGRNELSVAEIVRGPDRTERVTISGWTVSGGKSEGVQPGFRMTDPGGETYQVEVDPPSNPELATGAEMIGTAFYHAVGYNVVDVYLAELDRESLVIEDKATIRDPLNGRRRRLKKYRSRQRLQPRRAPRERAVPCARQPLRAWQAGRQLPILQPAPGRPERSRATRAPARAAWGAGLRCLAESR